jgi:hypothetical protein
MMMMMMDSKKPKKQIWCFLVIEIINFQKQDIYIYI